MIPNRHKLKHIAQDVYTDGEFAYKFFPHLDDIETFEGEIKALKRVENIPNTQKLIRSYLLVDEKTISDYMQERTEKYEMIKSADPCSDAYDKAKKEYDKHYETGYKDVGVLVTELIPGHALRGEGELECTDNQILTLINTLQAMQEVGVGPEYRGRNMMFNPTDGFTPIDYRFENGRFSIRSILNIIADYKSIQDKDHYVQETADRLGVDLN